MTVSKIADKSAATIESELQIMCPNVSAFVWDVDGEPKITFTLAPTDKQKKELKAYFHDQEHREWVDV